MASYSQISSPFVKNYDADHGPGYVRLEVWGERAIFTRPEFKVERYSYDVITPSAARNILQQIYWHPSMQYQIKAITVYNEIRRMAITRNELDFKTNGNMAFRMFQDAEKTGRAAPLYVSPEYARQQRSTSFLVDVHYAIEAVIRPSKWCKQDEPFNLSKSWGMFNDRAKHGKCFSSPYFGIREFTVNFAPQRYDEIPQSFYDGSTIDLGIMLFDIDYDYEPGHRPYFFHPLMVDGRIEIPTQKEVMGNAARCIE